MRRILATFLTVLVLISGIVVGGSAFPVSATAAVPSDHSLPSNGIAEWGDGALVPPDLTDVVAISAGGVHGLALRADGSVTAWGQNGYGQLNVPAGLTGVTAIDAGRFHNLAVRGDGTVVAWGLNNYGQTDVPDGLTNVVAVAAGVLQSLALRGDGTVVGWGNAANGAAVPEELSIPSAENPVIGIAAGAYHSLALRKDGTVVAWGNAAYGQLNVPADLTDAIAISGGDLGSIAVRRDGTVVVWGFFPEPPAGLTNVTAVAAGSDHGLALRSDGTVVGWGGNSQGQASVPAGVTNASAVAAGNYYSLALGSVPVFTADSPPTSSTVGDDYSYTFAASGAAAQFEGYSGSFPSGLSVSAAGVFSGTTTTAGEFTFSIAATNAFGTSTGASHTVRVAPATPPTITGGAPGGTVGIGYAYSYAIAGAPAPAVTVVAGTLPPGLALGADGHLSGTPTAAGSYSFTVRAANSAGTAQVADSITIADASVAPSISGVVAAGMVGGAYDYTYTVAGTPTPTVSLASGTLPPGLTLDRAGRLTGTPTTAGTFTFTVQASNIAGTATAQSSLTVSPQKGTLKADLRVDVTAPSVAVAGTALTYTLTTNNAGPATSMSVYSQVILPPNVQFVSATGKYTRMGNKVIFQYPSLTNGQTVTEKINVTATTAGRRTVIATTFSVKTPDPSIRSNADTAITTVR